MLKQFKCTINCIVTIHDITEQDAERVYRDDPNVGHYLAEPEELQKVIAQQRRLLHAILQHEGVLNRLMRRYVYEYIREHLYDELPKPPEIDEELFLVMAEAIDALDFSDRMFYLAYAAAQAEHEEAGGDPFEQHTQLVKHSFIIKPLIEFVKK
jgi:hypothetical protein